MKSTSLSAIQSGAISNFQVGPPPVLSELLKFDFSNLGDGPVEYYRVDDPITKWGASGDDRYRLIVSESFNQLDGPSSNFIDNANTYLADGMRERFGDSFFVNMSDWGAVATALGMSTAIVLGSYAIVKAAPVAAVGAMIGAVEYSVVFTAQAYFDEDVSLEDWSWSDLSIHMAIGAVAGPGAHLLAGALGGAVRATRSIASRAIASSKNIVDDVAEGAMRNVPKQGISELYVHTWQGAWRGNTAGAGMGGRIWATPYSASELANMTPLQRVWHIGRAKLPTDSVRVTGEALNEFVRVRGIGPFRLAWKRAGGQYYSKGPGSIDLTTGVRTADLGARLRYAAMSTGSYTMDGLLVSSAFGSIYAYANGGWGSVFDAYLGNPEQVED